MKRYLFSLFLALAFSLSTVLSQNDSVRVSLLTCDPGIEAYEVFGHTAIRVENLTQGSDIVFNYGLFNFNTPHFIWKFTLGQTDYILGADFFSNFQNEYYRRGSAIYSQQLNISQSEAHNLVESLYLNARLENRTYRYNFLFNNCSTMALDKIEQSIDGTVTYQEPDSTVTFRSLLNRYDGVEPWLKFGINLILGSDADKLVTDREIAFAPIELKEMARLANITDSTGNVRPLTTTTTKIVLPEKALTFPQNMMTPTQTMIIFFLITMGVCLLDWYRKKTTWWFDIIIFGTQGTIGLLIAFLYFFSEHPTMNSNWLVICLNPLPLIWFPWLVIAHLKKKPDIFFLADFLVVMTFILFSRLLPQSIETATLILLGVFAIRAISNYMLLIRIKYGSIINNSRNVMNDRMTAVLAALLICSAAQAQNQKNIIKPKLIVGIVVDEMSTEKLERYMPIMGSDGIKQVWMYGYNRTCSFHDYDNPDVSSAIASIYTGTVPFNHGIVAGKWMDSKKMTVNSLTDDSKQNGINTIERTSPSRLLSTNLADQIKLATDGNGKVCAISIERDGAILSAGHEADVAIWINSYNGRWCTSGYYGNMPSWTDSLNDSIWQVCKWEPLLLTTEYLQPSDRNRFQPFSYTYKKEDVWNFRYSPLANDKVTAMALSAVKSMRMGQDNNTDLLMLTMYGGNYVAKDQSEYSLEQQDIYVRLDRNIACIKNEIEKEIGRDNVLFFLTASGHFRQETPDLSGTRIPNGHISMERVSALLNLYLAAKYGQGSYIQTYYYNQIYLNKSFIEDKNISLHEIIESSIDLLTQVSGVKNVTSQRNLMAGLIDQASIRKRNSIFPSYSGDLILEINPGWIIIDELSSTRYYQNTKVNDFPFIIWGNGVRSEVNHDPVSISVLAPTIAFIAGVDAPNASTALPLKSLK